MREVKFRAWDKDEKKFWYFNLQEILERQMAYTGSFDRKILVGEKTQYTGLKDKNGTEIYEGDIVRCWGGEQCQGYHEFDEEITVNDMTYDAYYVGQWDGCLVIGNIYENPELTK